MPLGSMPYVMGWDSWIAQFFADDLELGERVADAIDDEATLGPLNCC